MSISRKCQYAVRALLELAKKRGQPPLRSSEIARRQAIPSLFLQGILLTLRKAGWVSARRGALGGYSLACDPASLTVGQVIRLVNGAISPVRCTTDPNGTDCPLKEHCSLLPLWEEARAALDAVYDRTTFAELARREIALDQRRVLDFCI